MINVVKEIDELLTEALAKNFTDIHLELKTTGLRIRVRKDGFLKTIKTYSASDGLSYLSRVKVMANLDINLRLPQDGRFNFSQVDVRVATIPLYSGEKIVLRLLTGGGRPLFLSELGMPQFMVEALQEIIHKMSGLILITGPTGSGKSTTLYSLLRLCDATRFNILTIEDPVEYQLPDINQVQVNQVGLNFSVALRNALRQDPDIIFIGEIRDAETAAIALRAALTGHLVMATLHTRDSKEAVVRLKDLGVPDYLLKNTIRAVLAQRLYRRFCSSCQGQGCTACDGDGFLGRLGIFEYFDPEKQEYYDFEQAKRQVLQRELTTPEELFFI